MDDPPSDFFPAAALLWLGFRVSLWLASGSDLLVAAAYRKSLISYERFERRYEPISRYALR